MKLVIHTDGGARGNPGPAAVGVVIEKCQSVNVSKKEIIEFGKRIGETTNNVAEYTGVIEALREIKRQRVNASTRQESMEIQFFLDSTLVVNQLNGIFKVKDPTLRELLVSVRVLEQEVGGKVIYWAIPREQNRRADLLVNKALDEGH